MIGTSHSHYRMTEKLGAGGTGEAYWADDTNLHRHVAIIILSAQFAHDAQRATFPSLLSRTSCIDSISSNIVANGRVDRPSGG